MSRFIPLALLLVVACFAPARAQVAGLPRAGSALDALSPPTSSFASLGQSTPTSPLSFATPTSNLFPSATNLTTPMTTRTSALDALPSQSDRRLTNPVAFLTGSASGVLASPGRYDSGASSNLSTLPAAKTGMMQELQIPPTSFGAPATIAPAADPQLYFGTKPLPGGTP